MQSQKFKDTRTGKIVTQVPLSEIQHFEEYHGDLEAGDFDIRSLSKPEPDFIDSHIEIIGVSEETADAFKNRIRRKF